MSGHRAAMNNDYQPSAEPSWFQACAALAYLLAMCAPAALVVLAVLGWFG